MAVMQIIVDYYRVKNLDKEKYALLRVALPGLKEDPTDEYGDFIAIIDLEDITPELLEWEGIKFKPIPRVVWPVKPTELKKLGKNQIAEVLNQTIQVHLPGNDLLSIRNVRVIENSCTDSLQGELDDGWRILAICPQPGNRRPDYILGKRNNQEE